MIHNNGKATEKWALSFGKSGSTAFIPTTNPKVPFTPLTVTGDYMGSSNHPFRAPTWTRIDLEVQIYFTTSKEKNLVLGDMGTIRMTLNPQFRSSTQTNELFQYLPEGHPTPGMDLPQIAYGGPPLESHLYPVGGTSMNYVRNLLEYLVSKGLLEDSSGKKVDSIPPPFEEEFGRYQEIWMKCWGDTKEGKDIIAAVHGHVLGTH